MGKEVEKTVNNALRRGEQKAQGYTEKKGRKNDDIREFTLEYRRYT